MLELCARDRHVAFQSLDQLLSQSVSAHQFNPREYLLQILGWSIYSTNLYQVLPYETYYDPAMW